MRRCRIYYIFRIIRICTSGHSGTAQQSLYSQVQNMSCLFFKIYNWTELNWTEQGLQMLRMSLHKFRIIVEIVMSHWLFCRTPRTHRYRIGRVISQVLNKDCVIECLAPHALRGRRRNPYIHRCRICHVSASKFTTELNSTEQGLQMLRMSLHKFGIIVENVICHRLFCRTPRTHTCRIGRAISQVLNRDCVIEYLAPHVLQGRRRNPYTHKCRICHVSDVSASNLQLNWIELNWTGFANVTNVIAQVQNICRNCHCYVSI